MLGNCDHYFKGSDSDGGREDEKGDKNDNQQINSSCSDSGHSHSAVCCFCCCYFSSRMLLLQFCTRDNPKL